MSPTESAFVLRQLCGPVFAQHTPRRGGTSGQGRPRNHHRQPQTHPMESFRWRTFMAVFALSAGATLATRDVFGQAAPQPSSGSEPQKLDAFVVTGSYIPSTET